MSMRKRQAGNTVWRFFFLSEVDWHSLAQPFINFFSLFYWNIQ